MSLKFSESLNVEFSLGKTASFARTGRIEQGTEFPGFHCISEGVWQSRGVRATEIPVGFDQRDIFEPPG